MENTVNIVVERRMIMKTLIAFFSRAGENYVSGALKQLEVGNTKVVAQMIQEKTDGDLFQIMPASKYSDSYNECINQAKEDQKRNARPALESMPTDLNGYDEIYLGYPNYWGTMPMAVFTFLEKADLKGKTIKPFCTHEGSGMGKSEGDIKKLCPDSKVEKGLAIHGTRAANSQSEVDNWIDRMEIK